MCPMDINIPAYLHKGQRVLSTECIFCLECINVCAKGALTVNLAFDGLRRQDSASLHS